MTCFTTLTAMSTGWRRVRWAAIAALLIGCSTNAGVRANEATPITTADDQVVPDESSVDIIRLTNGLTVYVRSNDRPGGSVEMRLVINAGSGQEEQDQVGVAHFVEHMMFNGTAKFPANRLIDTLRGFGMQFGADVNAYTSYDETVYELNVPTSDPSNVTTGLDVLREWLTAATLDPTEVEKEKGVVRDEWRQRDQTLEGRVGSAVTGMLLGASGYIGHDPIGTNAAITSMTPDLLRRFYDTWYRPDNAALVIVGDIDTTEIEAAIRSQFEDLAPRGPSATRTEPALAAYDGPDAITLQDADTATADVELILPHPLIADNTVASRRNATLQSLAFDMIATRLSDDISRGASPFVSATVNDESYVRRLDAPSIVIDAERAQARAALDALTEEVERARRFGFDATELDRAMRSYRGASQTALDSSATVQDLELTTRYVEHFLAGTPMPDADTTYQIDTQIYDAITAETVSAAFTDLLTTSAPHVVVVAPESASGVPTREDVLTRLAALPSLDISPRETSGAAPTELMTPPEPVKEISSIASRGDGGFIAPTTLTFANGARVVLNRTNIADDEIYFAATSPGGLSLVADGDVPDGLSAAAVVTSSGIGELDPVQLDTILSDATLELYPSIGQTSEDFSGSSSRDDLELLLQLVHLYFTAPRFDPAGLNATISSVRPYVDDPSSDPDLASYIAYTHARYGDEPRLEAIPTAEQLDSIDLAGVERVWKQRFTNASDWVFVLSGDFPFDDGRDLARRYIGTLSGSGAHEEFRDFQQDPPDQVFSQTVHAGTGDKGSLTIDWSAAVAETDTESVYTDVLASVLNTRLTDHIREQLGQSYSPNAGVTVNPEPDHLIESTINVTGAPDKIDEISTLVLADITDLRDAGPKPDELSAAIAEMNDEYQYFDNQTIGDLLVRSADRPVLLDRFQRRSDMLDEVTADTLRQFIDQVLPIDHYIEIKTLPG